MTALTDLSDLINKATGGNDGTPDNLFFMIDSRVAGAAATAPVAGRMTSLWQYHKMPGGSGAVPTTAAIPDNTTPGGLMQASPGGSREKFLLGMSFTPNNTAGALFLYDRLAHQGGLSGVTTGAQTTNMPTPTLTRYTDGIGNFIFVEIYTTVGTTARDFTVSYKNENGDTHTSKTTTIGGTGNREAQRFIIVPLQDGDRGVTTIESLSFASSTGTAGAFGVGIGHRIASLNFAANTGQFRDFVSVNPPVPKIEDDACLALMHMGSSTTILLGFGSIHTIES